MCENKMEPHVGVIRLTPEESRKFWEVLSDTSAAEANVRRLLEKSRGIPVERDPEAISFLEEALLKAGATRT